MRLFKYIDIIIVMSALLYAFWLKYEIETAAKFHPTSVIAVSTDNGCANTAPSNSNSKN